jgi:chromosome partitioning protein
MGKIVAIANQKGGVGKTTTAVNLAASLALAGEAILIVDTDPQGNSTSALGVEPDEGLYDVYTGKRRLAEIVRPTAVEGLSIIPSALDLVAVEIELVQAPGREQILKRELAAIRDHYRYIYLDCPPALGLLTLNALVAADSLLVPVQCEYFALEGLGRLTRTLQLIRDSYNPALEIEGILVTMFDSRNTLARQVVAELERHFADKVYRTFIPRNVTLAEAPSHGKPALLYDASSKGAQSYLSLAKEVLSEKRPG